VRLSPECTYRLVGAHWYAKGLYVKEQKCGGEIQAKTLFQINEGDFIYNRLFAWKGSFAVASKEVDGCFVSNEFPCFAPLDAVDPKFLWLYFSRSSAWSEALGLSSGSTPTSRNRLKEDQFLNMEVRLPPLDEQRRIVSRIEELAAKIDQAKRLRAEIQENELPYLRDTLVSQQFARLDDSVNLEEVCTLITDGTHQTPRYVDGGFTFLSARNIKPFKFMPEVHRKVSFEDYRSCHIRAQPARGDVLLTRVGAGIGEAAVVDRDLDFAFYVSLALIRPRPGVLVPEYLVHWLNSPSGRAQSRGQTLGKGYSQGNLNLKLLRQFKLPLPSVADQCCIVARLSELETKLAETRRLQSETGAELDALMPSILSKAFLGEL